MEISQKREIVIAVAAAALVVLVSLFFYYGRSGTGGSNAVTAPGAAGNAGQPAVSATKQNVPANTVVPNTSSSNLPAGVAKPSVVAPAAPHASSNFRSFNITANGNQFSPSEVIVNAGDTVHITITAVDKDYDFTQPDYGFSTPLPKGQQRVVEFQANSEGKFTFYCKTCGGPASGPVGYIIAVQK